MNDNRKYKWLVRVNCMTYNHAPYIEDAMNGFVMQQTTFPYVCTIVDDFSIDGEREVIKQFLENQFDMSDTKIVSQKETDDYVLTFARHKSNINCYFAVFFLKYNHYSIKKPKMPYVTELYDNVKYIAICEGDDYWIDPHKLDKQVSILNRYPKYSLVYTGFKTIDEQGNYIVREDYNNYMNESKTGWNFSHLLNHNYILTLTVCFRKELLDSPIYRKAIVHMDYFTFLLAASKGELYYLKDITSCYRKVGAGMMASRNQEVQKNLRMIHDFYANEYIKGELTLLPLRERICVNVSLTLYYLVLCIKGEDKVGVFRLFWKRPACFFLLPFSLLYGITMKIIKPDYSIVNGVN